MLSLIFNQVAKIKKIKISCFLLLVGLLSCPISQAGDAIKSPPLNEYGAVDVNAKVSLAEQVIEAPSNIVQPSIVIQSSLWPTLVPSAPQVNASSYVLMSANTGQVLAANEPNKRLPPASLTKLMLIYVVQKELKAGRIKLEDIVTVSKIAWATGGSRMFLKPGDKVSVRDLISGVLVASGNDAAVALAIHLAGTQEAFVTMMNHEAEQLGLINTHFNNVMGLPSPAHYSSSYDLARLAYHIMNDFPEHLEWFAQKNISYNGIDQQNYNKLLFRYQYAIGLKTGSTEDSGFALVSAAKKPDQDLKLIGVVMGSSTRDLSVTASQALLNYGFRFFKTQRLYAADHIMGNPRVYMAKNKTVPVGLGKSLDLTFPNVDSSLLQSQMIQRDLLKAPIHEKEPVGILQIKLQDKLLAQEPIIALSSDEEGSLWQRFKDRVLLALGIK